MSNQSMYSGVKPKEARIYIIGPKHSGIEEIGKALLRSDIKCLKRTTDVKATCQQFRASDGEERLSALWNDTVYNEKLEDGRLRIPDENLVVMVKSDLNSAMVRWALKHGEPSINDQRDDTREEQTSGFFLQSFTRKIHSAVENLQPEQVQKQTARAKACATYVEEQKEAERVFADMKMQPDTRSLEVNGDERMLAVKKICEEWVAMQLGNGGDA
ncbi:uncharacterized protein J4E78_006243 [Alternaria triticimaculans]|uniref:uncharacterized protein n=1 Tax=Alternaria triticimaculans TaxID=297637 RepID=UPI0020C317DF|nr:uncharacterized protein J4E78_006243 [Alternaria triticimaculans]KAI4657854.1 hypothetical protein J4E78_006243 [Alternaria triticimaculans]